MGTPVQSDTPFIRAGRLEDLEDGLPVGVVLSNGERVCVLRQGEKVYAVHDVCPHRAFGLSGGESAEHSDGTPVIECPWHGARFSCISGAVLRGPATDAIATFPVQLIDGDVFIGPRSEPSTDARADASLHEH